MSATGQSIAAARAAAEAARAVPGVLDLGGGVLGEFATYGGGDRVLGVRVRAGERPSVALKLIVEFGSALPELTDSVRAGVRSAAAGLLGRDDLVVDIDVVDVRMQGDDSPAALPPVSEPTVMQTDRGELTWRS